MWLIGPKYLSLPINEWPIHKSCREELPDRIHIPVSCNVTITDVKIDLSIIDLKRLRSYSKLIRTTSRVLATIKQRSLKQILVEPGSDSINAAETVWIKFVQQSLGNDWKIRFQRLGPMEIDGLITVGKRIAAWQNNNWNKNTFILVPSDHGFTKLYIKHLHDIDHAGIEVTLAKIQTKFGVPGAGRVIKSAKDKCVTCRK